MQRVLVALAAVVLLLAGCGGGSDIADTSATEPDAVGESEPSTPDESEAIESTADDDADADDEPATEPEETEPEDTDEEPAEPSQGDRSDLASAVADEDDPIATLLGFESFEDPSFLVNQQRRVDALTQECMLREGFTYTPQNLDADSFAFGRSIAPNLSDEQFAATYGYGFAEGAQRQLDLVNASADDPNVSAVTEMSDSERDAWVFAMLGPGVSIDFDTGELVDPDTGEVVDPTQIIFTGTGCASQANQEIFGSLQALFELGPQFEELGERFASDNRVIEITSEWAGCMAESGFTYAALADPVTELSAEVNALVQPLLASANQALFAGDDEPLTFTADQVALIDELQSDEIAIATADVACLGPFQDELTEIERGYELDFIDQNADALAAVTE